MSSINVYSAHNFRWVLAPVQLSLTPLVLIKDVGSPTSKFLFCPVRFPVSSINYPLNWITCHNHLWRCGLVWFHRTCYRAVSCTLFLSSIPGTWKVAAVSVPSDGFHNLYSEARVPGQLASSPEHLQHDHNGTSDPQTSTRGKRGLLQSSQPSSSLFLLVFLLSAGNSFLFWSQVVFFFRFLNSYCQCWSFHLCPKSFNVLHPLSLYFYFLVLQAHILVCRSLSNMLLLTWPNLPESEQQWHTRSSSHASLLAALTREYRILRGTVNATHRQPNLDNSQYSFFFSLLAAVLYLFLTCVLQTSFSTSVKAVIQQTLPVLKDMVDSISSESTKSRQICYQSLQESVQVSLNLFPVFIQQAGQFLVSFICFYLELKLISSSLH